MITSTYKNVEIVVPERRFQPLLEEWFDNLEDTEVKQAVRSIRWRELKPQQDWLRLYVYSQHPHPEEIEELKKVRDQSDTEIIADAAMKILNSHTRWVERSHVPTKATFDNRSVEVSWGAIECPFYDPDMLPAAERAQHELEDEADNHLRLIHLTVQPTEEFVGSIVGTNVPFFAAGQLFVGSLRLMNRVPADLIESSAQREELIERIHENADDFVILIRLAHHYGCRLPLVEKALKTMADFSIENSTHLSAWLAAHSQFEEENSNYVLPSDDYIHLDARCEIYRSDLAQVADGHELELIEAINSFLGELPIPDSPFKDDLLDDADWWKKE